MYLKWAINDFCNLQCPFCIAEKEPVPTLPIETHFDMLDKMNDMGVTSIDFFGKEPLLDDRIFRLMDYSRDRKYPFSFSAITNGINLPKYKKELILSPIRRLTISHDGFAKVRQKVLTYEVIREFVDAYFFVEITFDILKSNYKTARKTVLDFFNEAGVASVYVKPIIALGELSEVIKSDYAVVENEYASVCKQLMKIPGVTMSVPFRFHNMTQKYKDDPRFFCDPYCTCGSIIFLDCEGTAYGCGEVAYTSKKRGCDFLKTPKQEIGQIISTIGKRVCCE